MSANLNESVAEIDEFLLELDEDVEGMQNTIYYLQQQLKEAKEKLAQYETNDRQTDNKCVHNSNINTNSSNDLKAFERTLNSRTSDHQNVAEGVHRWEQSDENRCNAVNNADDQTKTGRQCVNSTDESVHDRHSTGNSERTNRSVVNADNEKINSLKDNYLSVNKKTDSTLNNNSVISTEDEHMSSDDDRFGEPAAKVAKLSETRDSQESDDSQTNALDFSLKSSDSLTLNNNRIEVNGQSNQ